MAFTLEQRGFTIAPKSDLSETRTNDTEWSDNELRAAVEAYLWMREQDNSLHPYTKTEVNSRLREELLAKRTAASIEYRMQNISAVLAELEEPWISGYKPAKNVGENTKKRILALLEAASAFSTPAESPTSDARELQQHTRRLLQKGIAVCPSGNQRPNKVSASTVQYVRDPAVRAYVLNRAADHCELCKSPAPFLGVDGRPYLEVHHIVPLAADGPDTVENAVALCPNCHRRCHLGQDKDSCADILKLRI